MNDSHMTRPSLLVRIRDLKDGQAWSQFVKIYSPLIYRYARRCGLQDADAADVTQEVLRKVSRSIGQFEYDRQKGSFRGWLISVAHGRVWDLLTRQGRQPRASGDTAVADLLSQQPAAADQEECWEQEYRRCVFDWAAAEVRDEFQGSTWQAFWQTRVEGKETKQVAEALGITEGAVYIAKCRVLARLKKKIQEADE